MEKRKYNYASCNRVDDSVLLEILRDKNESSNGYINGAERRNSCGCRADSNVRGNSRGNNQGGCAQMRYSCESLNENGICPRNVNSDRARDVRNNYNASMARSCNYNDQSYAPRREDSNLENECECSDKCINNSCINKYPPAMVYCPDHDFSDLYECDEALEHGTLFRVLDLVFYPTRCNNCR